MEIKWERYAELLFNFRNLNYSVSNFKELLYNNFKNGDKFAVCLLDISNLKLFNYKFGYAYGDKILKIVFYKVQQVIGGRGKICRFGGNTLLIILKDVACEKEAKSIVEDILRIFRCPIDMEEQRLRISINIGIYIHKHKNINVNDILKYSEIALSHSKKCNAEEYKFFQPVMYDEVIERDKVEVELANAAYEDEFILYYQPQIDAYSMKVFGAEALLRWRHPERGILPPSYFINIVEQSGMINKIGKFVINEACKELRNWHRAGFRNLSISINVSQAQLVDPSFMSYMEEAIEKTQVESRYIRIEITERVLINPTKDILKILSALRDRGMQIHIDDFGTKYSSLNYLYRLPIDGIKIDKSFIDRIQYSEKEFIITKNIVNLAHELNIDAIAEGVEQNMQLEKLKEIGCCKVQGFIFSKPVASGEFVNILNKFK